jgi:hypothetical protein
MFYPAINAGRVTTNSLSRTLHYIMYLLGLNFSVGLILIKNRIRSKKNDVKLTSAGYNNYYLSYELFYFVPDTVTKNKG